MIEVLPATEFDVDVVIDLEGRLFAEDSGVHEPHADVGWPAATARRTSPNCLRIQTQWCSWRATAALRSGS